MVFWWLKLFGFSRSSDAGASSDAGLGEVEAQPLLGAAVDYGFALAAMAPGTFGLCWCAVLTSMKVTETVCKAPFGSKRERQSKAHFPYSKTSVRDTFCLDFPVLNEMGYGSRCRGACTSPADFQVRVGDFELEGPRLGQSLECTRGRECSLQVAAG